MVDLTLNYKFTLPQYNQPGWDVAMNTNLTMIDTLLGQFNTGINLKGAWAINTLYLAGVSVIDTQTGKIWTAGVTNTSSNNTFAFDRAANPSYWTDITNPAISAQQSAINAAASAASVNSLLSSFRNKLHNGAMDIQQRGTGAFSCTAGANTYTADRWIVAPIGFTASCSLNSSISFGSKSAMTTSGAIPQSGTLNYIQRIEASNSFDLAGKQVTVQFFSNFTISAGTTTFKVELYYPSAVDNFTTETLIQSIPVTVPNNATATNITATFAALPANVANGLEMRLVANQSVAGGSIVWSVSTISLEAGIVANPFERRPFSVEYALCQRYYEVWNLNSGLSTTVTGVTWSISIGFKVTKRVVPNAPLPVITGTNASVSSATFINGVDQVIANITGSAATYCSLTGYTYASSADL